MATGDHWVAWTGSRWQHALQVDDENLAIWADDESGNWQVHTLPLAMFLQSTQARILPSISALDPQTILSRVRQAEQGQHLDQFSPSDEAFVRWCRQGKNSDPEFERARQVTRELATTAIQDSDLREVMQALGVFDEQDRQAILARLIMPGLLAVDALNLAKDILKSAAASRTEATLVEGEPERETPNAEATSTPATETTTPSIKKIGKFAFRSLGAAAAGMLLGGPGIAVRTMQQAQRSLPLFHDEGTTPERTRQWIVQWLQRKREDLERE